MRRNAKIDNNHSDIVSCLRGLGFSVLSLATIGRGCPDIVFARRGFIYMAEIKNPALGGKLNEAQERFRTNWNADVFIFDSIDSVLTWEQLHGH